MKIIVLHNDRICKKNFYTFIGINIYAKRVYLTYGIDEDTEFFLRVFKDIRVRRVETEKKIINKNIKETQNYIANFERMINEKTNDQKVLNSAIVYDEIYKQEARKTCATLPYYTLKKH